MNKQIELIAEYVGNSYGDETSRATALDAIEELRQQLSAAQADNDGLVKALQSAKDSLMHHRLFGIDTLQAWKNSHTRIEGDIEEAIAAHKARQAASPEPTK